MGDELDWTAYQETEGNTDRNQMGINEYLHELIETVEEVTEGVVQKAEIPTIKSQDYHKGLLDISCNNF